MTVIQLSTIQYQKEINYQTITYLEGLLENAYYQSERSQSEGYIVYGATIGHSGKAKLLQQ